MVNKTNSQVKIYFKWCFNEYFKEKVVFNNLLKIGNWKLEKKVIELFPRETNEKINEIEMKK